jgi:hypothetical protein
MKKTWLGEFWVVEMGEELGRPHDPHFFPAGSMEEVLVPRNDDCTIVSSTDHELVVVWVSSDGTWD